MISCFESPTVNPRPITAWVICLFFQLPVLAMLTGCGVKEQASPRVREENREKLISSRESTHKTPSVVVVGAGISGLSAALELARGGAAVTVVDMSSVFGGHAVMSQGGLSIIDTPMQRQAGIHDSPALAFDDFINWGEGADPMWVRYYVEQSSDQIYDWLIDLGVLFSEIAPTPGNTADRNHQPTNRGIGLVTPIYRACLELKNLRFLWHTRAEKLLVEDARLTGVETYHMRDKTVERLAADAVVLATGGFQNNLEMVRKYWPQEFKFPRRILVGSGRHSIGLGHQMAQQVGGQLVKMDYQWNYFTGIPDPRYPDGNKGLNAANMWGILVNSEGQRFANLHGWAKQVMPPLLSLDPVTCWFIFDEATKSHFSVSGSDWAEFEKVDRLILQNSHLVKKAETIEELARLTGLPEEKLAKTITRYNQLVAAGEDTDFGRFGPGKTKFNNEASPQLKTPPFYGMQTYPLTRKSMGGVAIDRSCRVVDKQLHPIHGLYAVGELTGLALINGKASLEGTFLGPCILTGRVAARSILARAELTQQVENVAAPQCTDCHNIDSETIKQRPGYWHFENVHTKIMNNEIDCRECHGELSPYDEENHQINPQVLTASCIRCHLGRE
ncbi:MAG: hypothetical protein CMJ81_18990 [Planctomycetaceae bacterium]|nr:hypothetical protein [Planctomycetaceae bacterium]MBP62674.1 hypothetical protein [Planctomycetaceae bacterium]